jgi:hypothetical protein
MEDRSQSPFLDPHTSISILYPLSSILDLPLCRSLFSLSGVSITSLKMLLNSLQG